MLSGRPSSRPCEAGFDGEAEQIAIVLEWIRGAFIGEGEGCAGRGFGIAIIEGVDKVLTANAGGVGHLALREACGGQFERGVTDVERES